MLLLISTEQWSPLITPLALQNPFECQTCNHQVAFISRRKKINQGISVYRFIANSIQLLLNSVTVW